MLHLCHASDIACYTYVTLSGAGRPEAAEEDAEAAGAREEKERQNVGEQAAPAGRDQDLQTDQAPGVYFVQAFVGSV